MRKAVTLVHKGAMPIAEYAVKSFCAHHVGKYFLHLHTDGSLSSADEKVLTNAAGAMPIQIVQTSERKELLDARLAEYPRTRTLVGRGGYFVKLTMPMVEDVPYFYFDSDIVWLREASDLEPKMAPNVFSTESWSWYNGVKNDREWIRQRVPRRVNSGFYFLNEPFPFERMESMLKNKLFDPEIPYNTDQEIMAFLYRDMELYHPDDLKRSRVGVNYNLASEPAVAMHFPGRMWQSHLDQIQAIDFHHACQPKEVRFTAPVPLSPLELLRMRWLLKLANVRVLQGPMNALRRLRKMLIN